MVTPEVVIPLSQWGFLFVFWGRIYSVSLFPCHTLTSWLFQPKLTTQTSRKTSSKNRVIPHGSHDSNADYIFNSTLAAATPMQKQSITRGLKNKNKFSCLTGDAPVWVTWAVLPYWTKRLGKEEAEQTVFISLLSPLTIHNFSVSLRFTVSSDHPQPFFFWAKHYHLLWPPTSFCFG